MNYKYQFLVLIAAAFLIASCASCPKCPQCSPCPQCPDCKPCNDAHVETQSDKWFILKVIDGDTVVIKNETIERKETVRFLRINTPERKKPGFEEAREALKNLVRGGYIELEFEKPGIEKRDGFGRLLAYVIAEGKNCNIEMVRLGWSKFWKKYGKGRLAEQFKAAEEEAKKQKLGLWADKGSD